MKRIDTLDVLRGFALIGIIFINITQMVRVTTDFRPADHAWFTMLDYVVYHRFFVIFSFLFGVGFYIFISRAKARGDKAIRLFVRRLIILLFIGIIHHYFQRGESLLWYAVIGFILIPFYKVKPTVVLILSILFVALGCYMGFMVTILGMFLLGLWAGQIGLFQQVDKYRRSLRMVQVISLILIPAGLYFQIKILDETGMLDTALAVGGLAISVFFVTSLTLLLERGWARKLFTPLRYLGRMALTNYLMQTVLILLLSNLFSWKGHVHITLLMGAAALILIVQMMGSMRWLKRFKMGPAEWLWRYGTYGRMPK